MKFLWLLFVLFLTAYQDIRERKISNAKIVFGAGGIFILRYVEEGGKGVQSMCLGMGVAIVVFLPLFLMHAIGAGDIKVFSLVAAVHGLPGAFQVLILWLLLAGIFSLWKMLSQHRLSQRMAYAWSYFLTKSFTHMPYYEKERDGTKDTVPLIPFLGIACLIVQMVGVM